MVRFVLIILTALFFSSCAFRIEKRQYRGGWYLEHSHKHSFSQQAKDSASSVVAEATIDSLPDVRSANGFIEEPYAKHDEVKPNEKPECPQKRIRERRFEKQFFKTNDPKQVFKCLPKQAVDEPDDETKRKRLEFNILLLGGFVCLLAALFVINLLLYSGIGFLVMSAAFFVLAFRSDPPPRPVLPPKVKTGNEPSRDERHRLNRLMAFLAISDVLFFFGLLFIAGSIGFGWSFALPTIVLALALLFFISGLISNIPKEPAMKKAHVAYDAKIASSVIWAILLGLGILCLIAFT